MRIKRSFSITVVTALLVTVAMDAPAHATASLAGEGCPRTWELVDTPFVTPVEGSGGGLDLDSVTALSAKDVRFVGNDGSVNPWSSSWDGKTISAPERWPSVPMMGTYVSAVSLSSAADGWAIVEGITPGVPGKSLARWHDGRWTFTPSAVSPDPLTRGLQLSNVMSVSATDAWAVGQFYQAGGDTWFPPVTGTLIEHWDGTRWTIVSNPAAEQPDAYLQAITAVSATDIWAAGRQTDANGTVIPMIQHYDGTQWRIVPAPTGAAPSAFYGIGAANSRDIWAVGAQTMPGTENVAIPLVMHWDGTQWSVVTDLPDVGNARLRKVYAASDSDVWAVGDFHDETRFLHWDGATWQAVRPPTPSNQPDTTYYFADIHGTGPDDIWAAGTAVRGVNGFAFSTPVIAHLSCGKG